MSWGWPREAIKAYAHEIDPECWISYSGKSKAFKQKMEARRVAALTKAEDHYSKRAPTAFEMWPVDAEDDVWGDQ